MDETLVSYHELLGSIKARIQSAQARAILAVNSEMIGLYWEIGQLLDRRQASEGWGAAVIPRLASDLRNEMPEVKGFSERNLKRMLTFYRAYPDLGAMVPPAVASVPASLLRSVPWAHHIILIEKVKDLPIRRWYMQAILEQGWTRDGLVLEIQGNAHRRQGRVASNFDLRLPAPQSDRVQQALKDPYLFDFLTLAEPFHERELETGLVQHLERFLLALGRGFAFVGRQYPLSVAGQDYYPDLLFYHVRLHCFLVIELKRGEFKPEYAGKMIQESEGCSLPDFQSASMSKESPTG